MARDSKFVNGATRLSQRIRTIRNSLALPVLTAEIGELLLRRTLDRFDREVDPDGKPWKPLSGQTLITKRRKGSGGRKMLVESGVLRASIDVIKGGSGSTFTNTGAGVRIGVQEGKSAKVARWQNNGTGHVPARRFLGIGALDVKSVDSFLRRRADNAVEQS